MAFERVTRTMERDARTFPPFATITGAGVALNRTARHLLGNPAEVAVFFDEDTCMVGVKATSGDIDGYKVQPQTGLILVRLLVREHNLSRRDPRGLPIRFPVELRDGMLVFTVE